MREPDDALSPATLAVTAGRPAAEPNAPLNAPLVLASTYVASPTAPQPGDLGYGRWTNPTWQAFETALGRLEGGDALLFASGMAAVSAVVEKVPDGGRVVVPAAGYNGTLVLLAELAERGRLDVVGVHVADTDAVRAALATGAHLLWLETPTNPLLEVADLPALVAAGHAAGASVTLATTVPPRGTRFPRPRRRRHHVQHPAAPDAARARRGRRRPLRDEVPRRALRRPARRRRDPGPRAARAAAPAPDDAGRHPRRRRGVARPARAADPAPAGRARGRQRRRARPPPRESSG